MTPGGGGAPTFDGARPYRLSPQVALRPESFGALAYHFGTRRLTFLKHPVLAEVVGDLGAHPSADAACAAHVADPDERRRVAGALATLVASGMVVERGAVPA